MTEIYYYALNLASAFMGFVLMGAILAVSIYARVVFKKKGAILLIVMAILGLSRIVFDFLILFGFVMESSMIDRLTGIILLVYAIVVAVILYKRLNKPLLFAFFASSFYVLLALALDLSLDGIPFLIFNVSHFFSKIFMFLFILKFMLNKKN